MSAVQSAFMHNQMAHMMQEMQAEFGEDNQGPEICNDDISEDDMSTTMRAQSLSADFNLLTIEERVPSSSSALSTHGSSSTAVRTDASPTRYITISGDHTEVDNNVYQCDFDSHKVQNNIIENSFGEGKRDIGVWRTLGMFICVS